MSNNSISNVSRRDFLQGGLGLTLAFVLPELVSAAADPGKAGLANQTIPVFEPNAFLRIGADSSVTVISKHLEMGQGIYTGLATLVAEELDADWDAVRVEGAPADAKRYNNLLWGPAQGTGGSTAMANCWIQMRTAGATARAMLISAAAGRWNVPASEITIKAGRIIHSGNKLSGSFGDFAQDAAKQAVPVQVSLKDASQFVLIGKAARRKDSLEKINGKAVFTQDIHLPDMLTAVVLHPPRFGAKLLSFDAKKTKAIKGVVAVVQIPQGVAVLAKDTWTAKKGRDALIANWDESHAFKLGSDEIMQRYQALAKTPGAVAKQTGDAQASLTGAVKVIDASFDFPYLAHAAMEPMNCIVQHKDGFCEVWNGEQLHTGDQYALAGLFGIKPEQVRINMLYAGGSFGRRASKDSDYVLEAAHIAKAHGVNVPVKLVWLREDDMRAGYYRPMFHHKLQAAIDDQGRLVAWKHRLVGQSIMRGSGFESAFVKDGIDAISVEGAVSLPYKIPNFLVELHTPTDIPVPVLWWRSVGSSHTAYSTEVFFDQVANALNKDPVAFRLELLSEHPRHAAVLKLAAEQAGWSAPLRSGAPGERRGRGVALHESFNSIVAQIAEVTVRADGSVKVDRVVCAVDCGVAINPDNIRSQMEGGVGFALSSVL
ncbi:MAG: xanthine dehydrogenase family protein molybdopterin-binding subunit, partial [Burkholderiales bacterium]|nr:xanthine dehydrogenase family protein molybdopterin-binding subunit [Burkholderiales bacterium]